MTLHPLPSATSSWHQVKAEISHWHFRGVPDHCHLMLYQSSDNNSSQVQLDFSDRTHGIISNRCKTYCWLLQTSYWQLQKQRYCGVHSTDWLTFLKLHHHFSQPPVTGLLMEGKETVSVIVRNTSTTWSCHCSLMEQWWHDLRGPLMLVLVISLSYRITCCNPTGRSSTLLLQTACHRAHKS